ncbi:hypothetical protein L596_012810 [Steinernema carpocapsae]|uniref:Nucleolar protein 10 n=1 Tax=Steinernema carpocapsae TaxID=34508 RepID=A0A4U5NZ60_STECR|nr:hypothetical protein L596_012810 [Steinernema carpocapsae]
MYLKFYLNEKGERVYTLKNKSPTGTETQSAHPARFARRQVLQVPSHRQEAFRNHPHPAARSHLLRSRCCCLQTLYCFVVTSFCIMLFVGCWLGTD